MICVKCTRRWSTDQFVGDAGQRTRTCKACRGKAKILWAERSRSPVAPPAVSTSQRITMSDHPRKHRVSTGYNDPDAYQALHEEAVRRGWMIGADIRVNWCRVHKHKARMECEDCLWEAAAWQSDRKRETSIEKLAKITEPEPVLVMTPRGAGGHKPGGSQFNRVRPAVDPTDLWIERR